MKCCSSCKQEKPLSEFYKKRANCKICSNKAVAQWKKNNIEKNKLSIQKSKLKTKYGITLEQYDEMVKEQKGVCYICKNENPTRKLNVDHCHKTGRVRKLLCDKCNMTLGLINDSQELLKQFIFYLK
jgi:hypothetical protein